MSQSYQNNNYCNRVALIIIKSVEACIPKPIQTCLHANSLVLMLSHEKELRNLLVRIQSHCCVCYNYCVCCYEIIVFHSL